MKELTSTQRIAHRTRLQDITGYCKGIELLTKHMKKDDVYVNAQYLQCLEDDANSIIYLVEKIKSKALNTKGR